MSSGSSSSDGAGGMADPGGLTLNIGVCSGEYLEPMLVTDFVVKFCNIQNREAVLFQEDWSKIARALTGVYVTSVVDRKRYKIKGFSSEPLSELRMVGETEDVVTYYKNTWTTSLRQTHWPAIEVGNRPIYLPMEVCMIAKGQCCGGGLDQDHEQISSISRRELVEQVVHCNNYNEDEGVSDLKILVDNGLIPVDARVLDPPELESRDRTMKPYKGSWSMSNQRVRDAANIANWTCIDFSTQSPETVRRFYRDLARKCKDLRMNFGDNPMLPVVTIENLAIPPPLDLIRSTISKLHEKSEKSQLLIVILPNNNCRDVYNEIKRLCDITLGIRNQCCRPKTVQEFDGCTLESLALKINIKGGGRNWILKEPINMRLPSLRNDDISRNMCGEDPPTIVFGAYVNHADGSPSIAAVVASVDWPAATHYETKIYAQTSREEIIQYLYDAVRELVTLFKRKVNVQPLRIIFYRDGVSDGVFKSLKLHEVDVIRKAYLSLMEHDWTINPKITYVVVTKRHNTRFFLKDPIDGANIAAGTVVDTKVCDPMGFGFFLNRNMGTSKSPHYHVVHDDNGFTSDQLQRFSNDLCYSCGWCTHAVALVPPVHYAHCASYRGRCYEVTTTPTVPFSLPSCHEKVRTQCSLPDRFSLTSV